MNKHNPKQQAQKWTAATTLVASLLGAVALFSLLGFVLWTVIPQLQSREYLTKAAVAYTPDVIMNDAFIFHPYTNAEGLIRYMLASDLVQKFSEGSLNKPDPLFDKATNELEEYVTRFPHYYDYFLMLGKAYEAQASLKNDPSLEKTAEGYYLKAIAVAPGRQDAVYAYAICLIAQGHLDEAIGVINDSLRKVPNLPDGHYELGQAYAVAGKAYYDQSLAEFELALSGGANLNPKLTLQIYQKFFYYYYHNGDLAHLYTTVKRLAALDTVQSKEFLNVVTYIDAHHSLPIIDIQGAE